MNSASKRIRELQLLFVGLTFAFAILGSGAYFLWTHPLFTAASGSGVPTVLEGDLLLTRGSKFDCGSIKPRPGDLVLFRHKQYDYLKRLIGLPGDRVQFKNGVVFVNGQAVAQKREGEMALTLDGSARKADVVRETLPNGKSYLISLVDRGQDQENTPEFVLPAGKYFVVGDSRDNSLDSRFAEDVGGIGFVPTANLCSVAERVLISRDSTHVWKAL